MNRLRTPHVIALASALIVLVTTARCGGHEATSPPTPTAIAHVSGSNQTGAAGQPLPQPLVVKVTDQRGAGFAGVTVSWAVVTGGGSLSSLTSQTGPDGLAAVQMTLGREPGSHAASATAAGLAGSPVAFSETATPNGTISGTITLVSGFLAPHKPKPALGGASPVAPVPLGPVAQPFSGTKLTAQPSKSSVPKDEYTPDELIITFHHAPLSAPPVGSAALSAPATAHEVSNAIHSRLAPVAPGEMEVTGVSPAILAARIRVRSPDRLDELAKRFRTDPGVLAVERNRIVHLDVTETSAVGLATAVPNDPLYPWQAWHYGMIDLPTAWDITKGSASILVAVVDQGIRFDHPALAANLTSDGYDFVSSSTVPLCGGGTVNLDGDGDSGYDPDPTQPSNYRFDPVMNCASPEPIGGHGVHVAGTIGAVGNDAVGVTGVNWAVKIRPVRVLGVTGSGTVYDIDQGILYAAGLPADNGAGGTVHASTGARIINLSLGSSAPDTNLHLAVIAASNAGALIVASAGNVNGTTPSYPAAYPEVIAVSAVGPSGALASYSNYASTSGIAAPGGDRPVGDTSFAVFSTMWNFGNNTATYQGINGTSMAAPHVCGVAALLLAQSPSLTAPQLRSRLTTYAVDVGAPGPDNAYGAGIVNARNSLTQTLAPPANLYARLYSASTGAVVQTVPVAGNGTYAFTGLPDGNYYVFAGQDENGDQQVGVPDVGLVARRWGALGGTATPSTVTVAGAGTYPASFSIALPTEIESNNTTANADALVVGGYIFGKISAPATDQDVYRVLIPQTGQYTFQTSGWIGACGFALEEDTLLGLYDANGTLITSNDDIDAANLNFCSRITATLSPGTYFVAVFGHRGGNYKLLARSGS